MLLIGALRHCLGLFESCAVEADCDFGHASCNVPTLSFMHSVGYFERRQA